MSGTPGSSTPKTVQDVLTRFNTQSAIQMTPEIEKAIEGIFVRELAKASAAVPEVGPQSLDVGQLLHQAEARNAALKQLGIGLIPAVLTGVATGATAAVNLNWFTKEGAIAAGVLVLSSIWHSLGTYFSKIKVTDVPSG